MSSNLKNIIVLLALCMLGSSTSAQSRDLWVAVLTDLHITPGSNWDKQMPALIEEVNSQQLDLVVVDGDLTNRGTDAELENIHAYLESIRHPHIVTEGNHETTWSESADATFRKLWGHSGQVTADVGDYRFVGYAAGPYLQMAEGTIRRKDLLWADSVMKAAPNKRIVNVCHYPIAKGLTNCREVLEMLRGNNVAFCISGHTHRAALKNYGGIPGYVCRALINKSRRREPFGYNILQLKGDSVIVHTKILGEKMVRTDAFRQYRDLRADALPRYDGAEPVDYSTIEQARLVVDDCAGIYTGATAHGELVYYGNADGELICMNMTTGKRVWSHRFSNPLYCTPLFYKGTIIEGTVEDGIHAFDALSGKELWSNSAKGIYGDAKCDRGRLYISSRGKFNCIDCHTGNTEWQFSYGTSYAQAEPAVDDRHVIFCAWDLSVYCLDKTTGELKWRWQNPEKKNMIYASGHVVPRISDGRVMIVGPDRVMTALRLEDGKQLWRNSDFKVRETTGITPDGKGFLAKTMDGEMIRVPFRDSFLSDWVCDSGLGYDHSPCPIVCSQGSAYMTNKDGYMVKVRLKDGKLQQSVKLCNSTANLISKGSRGELLISFIEGKIFVLRP